MSTQPQPQPNGKPSRPAPGAVLIRSNHLNGEDEARWKRHLPAWVISGGVHVVLIAMAVLILSFMARPEAEATELPIETKLEDKAEEEKDLVNPDVGLDPEQPFSVDTDRMEAVTVTGDTSPDDPVGTPNADPTPPTTTEPPPGVGGGEGAMEGAEGNPAGPASSNVGGQGGSNRMAFRGSSAARAQLTKEGGGNTESEAAVARGLIWLAAQQKLANGSWAFDGKRKDPIAATGISLLPFLAAGQTHKSGKYTKNVLGGLLFLMGSQKPDGSFTGSTVSYSHAIATVALCEAYGMTQDPRVQRAAQMALNVIVRGQAASGVWGYSYGSATGDTSIAGWQLQAVKSGQMAGLSVPKETFSRMANWLDSVAGENGATYGYAAKGGTPNMTAVGLLCREYMGWGPKNIRLQAGIEYLKKAQPPDTGALNMYYYYYATQVMHFYGGPDWSEFWNPKMRDRLIKLQDKSANKAVNGSWAPDTSTIGTEGGRLMTTCKCLLTLEVYYRHLPLYRRDNAGLKELEG